MQERKAGMMLNWKPTVREGNKNGLRDAKMLFQEENAFRRSADMLKYRIRVCDIEGAVRKRKPRTRHKRLEPAFPG